MRKEQERNLQKMIKKIDKELDDLYERIRSYDPGDKDEYIIYGQYMRRMQELTKLRGDLIQQERDLNKDNRWTINNTLQAAQIATDWAKIGVTAGMTTMVRNSEMNNERITFRSSAYKYVPKIQF